MGKNIKIEMNITIDDDELFPGQTIEELILDQLEEAPFQIDDIRVIE